MRILSNGARQPRRFLEMGALVARVSLKQRHGIASPQRSLHHRVTPDSGHFGCQAFCRIGPEMPLKKIPDATSTPSPSSGPTISMLLSLVSRLPRRRRDRLGRRRLPTQFSPPIDVRFEVTQLLGSQRWRRPARSAVPKRKRTTFGRD